MMFDIINKLTASDIITLIFSITAFIFAFISIRMQISDYLEKKKPKLLAYLEFNDEITACIVLKNIHEVPLVLHSLSISDDWLGTFDKLYPEENDDTTLMNMQEFSASEIRKSINELRTLSNTNVVFMPQQEWMLIFNVVDAYKLNQNPITIKFLYSGINKFKKINGKVTYDLKQYKQLTFRKSELEELNRTLSYNLSNIFDSVDFLNELISVVAEKVESISESMDCIVFSKTIKQEEDSPDDQTQI